MNFNQYLKKMFLESAALSKNYFEQKYKNRLDYDKIMSDVDKVYKDKLSIMINDMKIQSMTINFLRFITFEKKDLSQTADLIHDIISELDFKVYVQKFIPLMKDSNSQIETIKSLYEQIKKQKNDVTNNEQSWKIVEDSYVELPNQDKIVLKNFKGTNETKVIPIDNDAKWFVGTAIPEKDLKNSPLYAKLSPSDIKALTVASKRGEIAVRRACPLDAKRGGHCGAVPYVDSFKNSIFLMLKHSKQGQSVASVFVDDNGNIIESKAPHNQSVAEKYYLNLVWLMNHEWVKGTAWGGNAPDKNFFIYKLKDEELAKHMYDYSKKNLTNVDKEIYNMRKQYRSGSITADKLFDMIGN
jgi:hypothetical protein